MPLLRVGQATVAALLVKARCPNMPWGKTLTTAPPAKKLPSERMDYRLIWIDLEMTGLDANIDHIMEIACIVTDDKLTPLADGVDFVIHQPENILQNMNDWCKEHHGKSGLTKRSQESKISLQEAEDKVLSFVQKHTLKGTCPLAGNSVYMDRTFLMKYMPKFNEHMHYRIVDVSTVKELCRRWAPKVYEGAPRKKFAHRALDDIQDSIQELKFYRENFFKVL